MYLLIRVTWQNRTTPCLSKYSLVPSKYKCCHFQRHSESSVCSSVGMTCEMCSMMGNTISHRHGAASPSRYKHCVCSVAAVDNDFLVQIGTLVWATPCLATLPRLCSDHSNHASLSCKRRNYPLAQKDFHITLQARYCHCLDSPRGNRQYPPANSAFLMGP